MVGNSQKKLLFFDETFNKKEKLVLVTNHLLLNMKLIRKQ